MLEKFTLEGLKRLKSSGRLWIGEIKICPFCKTRNFRFMGTVSPDDREEEETDEFKCTNCWFGGYKEKLLNGQTKKEQTDHYREVLKKEINKLKRVLRTEESILEKYKP